MKFVEKQMEKFGDLFKEGKPLARLYPFYEALDSFVLTTGKTTKKAPFVRDTWDIKRVMILMVLGLLPCLCFGVYNTGYQILLGTGAPLTLGAAVNLGLAKVLPIIIVTFLAGGFWEVLFAVIRRHEINEGFLVTGMLFSLILPPTIPLWQVAMGISFGVVIGKEVFGGTGYNIFNPALAGRAFLFFSYPKAMSGESVWVAVDGLTRATPLAVVAQASRGQAAVDALQGAGYSFGNMFLGFIPGSIGETSALACLTGLVILLITGVASWRIMAGCALGLTLMSGLLSQMHTAQTLAFFSLPVHWHMVMGGFAFGTIFMATDPVSSSATNAGRWIYGMLVGILVVVIRVFNPGYPEGVMLAILLMNAFAPLIDHFVVEAHVRRRHKREKLLRSRLS